jgi:hypothetical protein
MHFYTISNNKHGSQIWGVYYSYRLFLIEYSNHFFSTLFWSPRVMLLTISQLPDFMVYAEFLVCYSYFGNWGYEMKSLKV